MPPPAYAGTPVLTALTAGTILFRVHKASYSPVAFNSSLSHRYYGGGRFDPTDDDAYTYLYAGESIDVAIAETLLRDLPFDQAGVLRVPLARIRGRRISMLSVTTDLALVSLRKLADLAAVSQDPWLTTCGPSFYAQSRHWAHWIRQKAPTAAGYVWMSHREPTAQAYVLFGDRVPDGAIAIAGDPRLIKESEAQFDSATGRRALRRRLATYNVAVSGR